MPPLVRFENTAVNVGEGNLLYAIESELDGKTMTYLTLKDNKTIGIKDITLDQFINSVFISELDSKEKEKTKRET